ncbi:HTH-type transcriptional regulator KipR [Sulfitobacter sp. DSM 110093]|uniref:IclR family transcriptional regulator n=1 Tax=Sulfitobacter sp. DSM 110093 TaxID=2883127 RepID=UPI001FAC6413|nr:helix-turn-helix domain-containing protein [Sulfitobacter sp. DSM 110093]UOA30467.1 HTH-type transcriptional regulator KipR [Sulfitobacter sp. DSM 110093]
MTKLNRSVDRGMSILEAVHSSGKISLAALATGTGLPKPTVLRICATLEERRWLFRRNDGSYQLGSGFPQGSGMPHRVDRLVAVGKSVILQLSEETGLACDLAAGIGGGRVEIVDTTRVYKVHSIYPDAVGFRPSPTLSALGAAYLYAMPKPERTSVLQTFATHLPREEVQALLQLPKILRAIGDQGYAVRSPGHWGRAVDYGALPSAIAVPIIAEGKPIGAVNLIWNSGDRSLDAVVANHLSRLRTAAELIGNAYAPERSESA